MRDRYKFVPASYRMKLQYKELFYLY